MRQYSTYQRQLTKVLPQEITYHRKFRSLHDEAGISRYNCEAENQSTQERKLITRQVPGPSRIYAKVCIFCEKVAKYKKGSRSREPLIQYCDVKVDDFIRATAIAKGDVRITAIVSRELVTAEACYPSIMLP